VVIIALLWAAFNAAKLPLIGGGTVYTAAFPESADLQAGNEVRIAGLTVGAVTAVTLQNNQSACTPPGAPAVLTCVKVTFRVKNAFVGDTSFISINLKSLLGAKYLAVDSTTDSPNGPGHGKQNPSIEIPVARTMSPYDIYTTLGQLTTTVNQINTTDLGNSFNAIATALEQTPNSSVKTLLDGLSRLSQTVSSRDAELTSLLAAANNVTGVLASRDQQVAALLSDGGLLLDELNQRRDAIHSLLLNTASLSAQLQGLVSDNQATIGPMLQQLGGVLNILQANQDSLDRGLQLLAPFYRVFTNTLGNGRWFDSYISNLSVCGILGLSSVGCS
jgi:phospholipid/cholesterol/gamma-HCH transport system substrate-binding protein